MSPLRLSPAHTPAYRALMLEAYARESDAFTSTAAEREPLPLAIRVGSGFAARVHMWRPVGPGEN